MQSDLSVKVIIVDDSLVYREVLARGIASDPEIRIIAKASDPFEARDRILEYDPDVMICDVEMPRMNGIEFLRRLLPQHPIPVIVISSDRSSIFDALEAGAIDFVPKPGVQSAHHVEAFLKELIRKIKICARANPIGVQTAQNLPIVGEPVNTPGKIIAIGASTGGTDAIHRILKQLPSSMPPILVVQHIPPVFSRMFAERLNASTSHRVKEAQAGDILCTGSVVVAPGDRHMRIRKCGSSYKVELVEGEKVNGHCPSVDILFESVAKEAGSQAVGVLLTGMGYDGAKGLLQMKRRGARTIGQGEEDCVVYGMPKVAYNMGAVERQVSLNEIPKVLCSLL